MTTSGTRGGGFALTQFEQLNGRNGPLGIFSSPEPLA